jgi:putative flippase GtrA
MRLSRFVRFVLVGVAAGAINILARIGLSRVFSYEIAVALAFPIALTFAFVINRRHVFDGAVGSAREQYAKFAAVNLLALVQVWAISVALARVVFPHVGLTWHAETIAHSIGVMSPIATSFFAYKYFVFARK